MRAIPDSQRCAFERGAGVFFPDVPKLASGEQNTTRSTDCPRPQTPTSLWATCGQISRWKALGEAMRNAATRWMPSIVNCNFRFPWRAARVEAVPRVGGTRVKASVALGQRREKI